MAPQSKIEFVILRLSFHAFVPPQTPRFFTKQKKTLPSCSIPHIREWFARVLSYEKSNAPPNLSINYCEWKIRSSNALLFTVNGYRFDRILLVLGEEVVHWVFYENCCPHRRMEGWGRLALNYCGCCLNNQYLNIMRSVMGCVHKKCISH